jgi:glyoxylase I family protein
MTLEMRWIYPLLQVFDMPTSLHFYRDILGFSVVQKSGDDDDVDVDWAWLRQGDVELMLNTAYERAERPSVAEPWRVVAHGDTLLYFGCENVDTAYERLLAQGVKVEPPTIAPYGMKELRATDPDGLRTVLPVASRATIEHTARLAGVLSPRTSG